MKNIFLFILSALVVVLGVSLLISGNKTSTSAKSEVKTKQSNNNKKITIGATSGPYTDMVNKAIKPQLEKKGYQVEVVEFSDYIQPNKALQRGDLDANLYQNRFFTKQFNKENKTDLTPTYQIPTAPMGLYSGKYHSLEEIKEGSEVAIPNDPVNMTRGFNTLRDAKLITISKSANKYQLTEKDVENNKLNLKFVPMEAGQLPRSAQNIGLAAVPGNFAIAAKMKLSDSLKLEEMGADYRNRLVVRTDKLKDPKTKDLNEIIQSKAFYQVIDAEFKGFNKPKKGEKS